jgi:hypothetical protein
LWLSELPGWAEVRAIANHRSPHDMVRFIGMLSGALLAIEAAGPLAESDVGMAAYAGGGAAQGTREALHQAGPSRRPAGAYRAASVQRSRQISPSHA